jgi:hypothetical protein
MRAKEFVINIPINIKLNSDGSVDVDQGNEPKDTSELDQNPTMVPPLQQHIELTKASVGKSSPVISKLTQDEEELDPDESDEIDRNNRSIY